MELQSAACYFLESRWTWLKLKRLRRKVFGVESHLYGCQTSVEPHERSREFIRDVRYLPVPVLRASRPRNADACQDIEKQILARSGGPGPEADQK